MEILKHALRCAITPPPPSVIRLEISPHGGHGREGPVDGRDVPPCEIVAVQAQDLPPRRQASRGGVVFMTLRGKAHEAPKAPEKMPEKRKRDHELQAAEQHII